MNSSSLIKNGLLRDDHPLKLRVKALIEHRRFSDSFFLPAREEVCNVLRFFDSISVVKQRLLLASATIFQSCDPPSFLA